MESLEQFARRWIPAGIAQKAKQWLSVPRFRRQFWTARRNYLREDLSYRYPLLFVAGLPKSGTSWLESMLASYPGYETIMPPCAVAHEQECKGSHNFDLPADTFTQLKGALAVLKLHAHGSSHNVRLLQEAEIPYVVLYRDLRDVAVSHYFYVRRTPWHPEYEDYCDLDVEDGLRHFGHTLLPEFVDWMWAWRENRDPEQSIEVRYEDLLENTSREFRKVASHFDLDTSSSTISHIVGKHSFESMSDGRVRGEQNENSFVRKGVSGDWKNHFTPALKNLYKEKTGKVLVKFGYEANLDW